MNDYSRIPAYVWRLLFAAALIAVVLMTEVRAADCACTVQTAAAQPVSWIFAPSRYTNDPETGARVAQYAMKPPVEPLPDPRDITSGYSRNRTVLRGADGSSETYYRVRSYGNGRGGLDAEWERFHDAWRGARISGGAYEGIPPFFGFGPGFGGYGYGGFPGYGGFGPGFGFGGGPVEGDPGGNRRDRFVPGSGYGQGHGRPDPGFLDPDATDGYRDPRPRTPDREFFNRGFRPRDRHHEDHD